MRVVSKLAQIDFQFGRIERQGNLLVVESHPDAKMKSTVYLSPQDVVEYLRRLLANPSAILFFIGLPLYLFRWRRSGQSIDRATAAKREWPTV